MPPHGHQEGKKSSVAKKRTDAAAGSGSSVATAEMPPHGHQEGKKRADADTAAGSGSSVAMAEMPPHGPAPNHIQPPRRPLPPGVFFSPTRDDCLGLLNRWIAGDKEMRDVRGYVFRANVYGESPDALRQRHLPASIRGPGEHAWWFLSQTRFQSKSPGGGTSKRADRHVETGGYWRLEQSKKKLDDDGFKTTFGYYVDGHSKSRKKDKTPWLMQEFVSANDDGASKRGMPALYRVYVTPHATDDQLSELFGEDGLKLGPDGKKKPGRAKVQKDYFDAIVELLPEGSARGGVVQEHVQPPPPPQIGQQEHNLDQYEQPAYYSLENLVGPHQIQQEQYLGRDQEHGPFWGVAPPLPPPASPGLLADIGDASPDNVTMSIAEFRQMINEQPAETDKGDDPNEEG